VTSIGETQPLADRARSRERGPAVVGVLSALISTVMPRDGVWWLLFALAAGVAGLIAVSRMLTRAGSARRLPWPEQPAVGIGSFWVSGLLALACLRGPLPHVWVWSLVLVAGFVGLFGIFMLAELLISREGTPAGEAQAEYGTTITVGAVLAAVMLVVVSAALH
jgi:hypothetical protein